VIDRSLGSPTGGKPRRSRCPQWHFRDVRRGIEEALSVNRTPGMTERRIEEPPHAMQSCWAVELAIRDAAGRSWVRETDGALRQIDEEPAAYYGLAEPISW